MTTNQFAVITRAKLPLFGKIPEELPSPKEIIVCGVFANNVRWVIYLSCRLPGIRYSILHRILTGALLLWSRQACYVLIQWEEADEPKLFCVACCYHCPIIPEGASGHAGNMKQRKPILFSLYYDYFLNFLVYSFYKTFSKVSPVSL